ncbi:hypothetical protein JXA12_02440 [Candidatus Woesearchaeota archaeon]|nr:hypothetical protein [Candidatus Woesearchaeota archaeon]
MARKPLLGWVDILLLGLIILNILDFSEVIWTELDLAKKLLSWGLLGALLYQASPSKVLFGTRKKQFDTLIIAAYFLMIIKDLTYYTNVTRDALIGKGQESFLLGAYTHLASHTALYEQWGLLVGVLCLCVLAAWASSWPFSKRSVMGVLHEDGEPGKRVTERYAMTLLVLLGFFVFVFNLVMEWLAIAVDATIVLVALLFYSTVVFRHRVSVYRYLQEVGNAGAAFYRSFIDHFRYKETFLLGIVGLLVLHLLTDVGNFIIPYLTGIKDILYFGNLEQSYAYVWQALSSCLGWFPGFLGKAGVIVVFIGNIAGFLLLFTSPALIWHALYHRRHPSLPGWLRVTFFSSLPAVAAAPLFVLARIGTGAARGVQVQPLLGAIPLWAVVTAMAVMGGFAAAPRIARAADRVWVVVSSVFFGRYVWLYFLDLLAYFKEGVPLLFGAGKTFLGVILFVFLVLNVLLYIGGFALFLYELGHRPARR